MGSISIGDEAPNFDLSSTEDALLMLRDEVGQATVVLYFFADPESDAARRDLDALNRGLDDLKRLRTRVLAISPAKLDDLKKVQVARKLLFPLLHDDRNFAEKYGVSEAPALVAVSREQRVLWQANPVTITGGGVESALPQVLALLKGQPSLTAAYPRKVVNRLVDRWVN